VTPLTWALIKIGGCKGFDSACETELSWVEDRRAEVAQTW